MPSHLRNRTGSDAGRRGKTSPRTRGGSSMGMDLPNSTSGQPYFRSGTQYWTMNVTMVVRAAPAEVVSLTPAFASQCFSIGIRSVTSDAASTPMLTFAVGAQLVGAFAGAGAGVGVPCGAKPVAAITSSSLIEVYGNPEEVYHHQNVLQRSFEVDVPVRVCRERRDILSRTEV